VQPVVIRRCSPADAAWIAEIYNHYVRETVVTFEELCVTDADMAQRIGDLTVCHPWLVWEQDGSILGYAYASSWKARSAYRFAVESTVYLAPACTRQGIGSRLYEALIADLRSRGVHCVVGGIALPNPASIALHEKFGFRKIGQFDEVGWKFGAWVDVGYWELLL
jgi:phosphinothricin acetyltransferase